MIRLKKGTTFQSPVTDVVYRVVYPLGSGGFGSVYEVEAEDANYEPLCLKVTTDSESWHREAYFGALLKSCDRAIRLFESFPHFQAKKKQGVWYCLVSELAEHGTIVDHQENTGKPWSVDRAKREVIALLKVLEGLHRTGAVHRDITPMNVFVCKGTKLKLGDFGIACHVLGGKQANASVFNRWWVSARMAYGQHRYWLPADDVFQMGQLLYILLSGDASGPVGLSEVKKLNCPDDLKQIISKAIHNRSERYDSAGEMLHALKGDVDRDAPCPSSLRDLTVVLTGPLQKIKREDAAIRIRQCGGIYSNHVTSKTDVLVQGGCSSLYLNGHKGTKLIQAEKLVKQGQTISIISEREFLGLI